MDHGNMDRGDRTTHMLMMDNLSHSHHDDMGGNNNGMMHSMQMTFYAGCESTILFNSWQTKNCLQMFGSCLVIILAGIVYEGLKALRNHLQFWMTCRACKNERSKRSTDCCSTPSEGHQSEDVQFLQPTFGPLSKKQALLLLHLLQSFLYLAQVGFGYLIMLVAMTFNAWLFISIFIGAGVGYFIFNFKKVWDIIKGLDACPSNDEGETHCHL